MVIAIRKFSLIFQSSMPPDPRGAVLVPQFALNYLY